METAAVSLLNGGIGLVVGALLIARRDGCALAVRDLCRLRPRWSPLLAGAVAGSGLSMLIAAAWLLHTAVGHLP